ncbi:hypothetical protein ABZX92_27750 [Lentzea sp. NPDC006480]|uniref:hypothetical protein n=1 Tax=Lentzea sp. NPDC006480 TaxID=3157176 RepID=UPI0033BDD1D1
MGEAQNDALLKSHATNYLADLDLDRASPEQAEMRFKKYIFPHLGDEPLDEINASALRS